MKKIFCCITVIILIIAYSCKKEVEDINPGSYIIAGDYSHTWIKYVDLNPDSVFTSAFTNNATKKINLDINKDGINDYELILFFSSLSRTSSSQIQPLGNNMIYTQDSNWTFIVPVKVGDTINRHLIWVKKLSFISNCIWISGGTHQTTLWKENEIDFVGIMMPKDNDTLYGWIRIKLENAEPHSDFKDKITVLDWAYTLN
jgi:hypothetical protein